MRNFVKHFSKDGDFSSKSSLRHFSIIIALFLICGCASVKNESPELRMKALNKITKVNKLHRIVLNEGLNDDVRDAALMKLPQNLLSEILLNSNCKELLKIKAIKLADNQDVLCEVAIKGKPNLAEIAVKNLSQSKLKQFLIECEKHNLAFNLDLSKRKKMAVDCLDGSDQNFLYEIALSTDNDNSSRYSDIRNYEREAKKSAVSKISQYNFLTTLAMESNRDYVRIAAIERIDDSEQELLYKIVLNDNEINERGAIENVKKSAISKISRRDILEKLVLGSELEYIRLAAIDQIDDSEQDLLYVLACDSIDNIASKALNRLSKSYLSKLFDEAKNIKAIENAIRYVDGLSQDLIYKATLMNDGNIARAAVKKLSRNDLLAKVVNESKVLDVRLLAVSSIDDQEELIKIVQKNSKYEITKAAYKKLDEKSLAFLAKNAKDSGVALAAKISLKEVSWDTAFSKNRNVTLGAVIGAAALVDNPKPTASSVVEACHTYIRRGDASRISELRTLLLDYGDKTLAEDYLNCGKAELEDAAREWARRKGYSVGGGYGSNRVRWGGR